MIVAWLLHYDLLNIALQQPYFQAIDALKVKNPDTTTVLVNMI